VTTWQPSFPLRIRAVSYDALRIDEQWNLIKGRLPVDEISKLANEYQDKYFPS